MPRLANLFWRAFTGTQAHLATGNGHSRRYAPGFPPIIAFADPPKPDFASLAAYCQPGDRFYVAEWSGPPPTGWTIEIDTFMCAMVLNEWTGKCKGSQTVRLQAEHVAQMTALAALTKPGPFAQRPMEIGEWYGVLDGEKLVAMAGERAADGRYREISGVCTLPEYQGRGYARLLTERVIQSQRDRGLTPFLHVASANARARSLYERMGFVVDQEVPMRVVTRDTITR
jgi:ribosomal protein S18 acetylase RimI-like enzyme